MMPERTRKAWIAVAPAVLLWALALLIAGCLIRNLYCFLDAEPQFQAIFAQIQSAKLGYPLWLLLPQAALCVLAWRLRRGGKKWSAGWVLLGGWLLIFLCALYFTRVNGILFGDVMVSLVQLLMKGGLEL